MTPFQELKRIHDETKQLFELVDATAARYRRKRGHWPAIAFKLKTVRDDLEVALAEIDEARQMEKDGRRAR